MFIGVSFLVAQFCYYGKLERRPAIAIAGALAVGAVTFVVYKLALPFSFTGRAEFMAQHAQDTLTRNLYFSPGAFAPIILWFWLIAPRPARLPWLMLVWLLVLSAVATLISDVTRVITITSLPIVLAGANKIIDGRSFLSAARALTTAILIVLIPPLNWSGLDYLLWPDLIGDLCKWHLYCSSVQSGG